MTHESEIHRWAKSPNGTKVWQKTKGASKWTLTLHPKWDPQTIYIVDDKQQEIRRQWIDEGKPQLQIFLGDRGWEDIESDDLYWLENREYRIKQGEWYEDIPEQGILCWVWDNDPNYKALTFVIDYDPNGGIYRFVDSNSSVYRNAKPVSCHDLEDYILKDVNRFFLTRAKIY